MATSYFADPTAWPPRQVACPLCEEAMRMPKPMRLSDRCCQVRCSGCYRDLFIVDASPNTPTWFEFGDDEQCFNYLSIGTGPLLNSETGKPIP
jgi:hypothetical protein